MSTPVVMIGLDGATFDWLIPLAAEGVVPNLKAILESGSSAPLVSTMPPLTPPGWASCLTGVSPRLHGLWDFVRRRSAHSYDLLPTYGGDVKAPWLWNRLDPHRRRSVVLSLPFTYPARALNGQMVCGFDTTDRKKASYPTHLLGDLEVSLDGPYPFFYEVPARHIRKLFPNAANAVQLGDDSLAALEPVVAESRRFTRDKLRAATMLAAREPFDFLFVHVFETDHLSHEAWTVIADPAHPHRRLLIEYFRTLDQGIGKLIEAGRRWAEPVVVLASDHGFGPCKRRLLLNDWLVREGFLSLKGGNGAKGPRSASWGDIDWARTRAYSIQTGIYLNTSDTHPGGTVAERDMEPLRQELVQRLRETLGPDAPALRVEARDRHAKAVQPELAPDLVVHLENDICAMGYGELHGEVLAESGGLEGYHRMNGIFIASGPGIRAGQRLEPIRMVDCVPTLLHLLGISELDGLEGRVVTEILEAPLAGSTTAGSGAHPNGSAGAVNDAAAGLTPGPGHEARDDTGLSAEDIEEVRRRLVALGYME